MEKHSVEQQLQLKTLRELARALWPANRRDLRIKVCFTLICLAVAKVISVGMPLIFRDIVNTLGLKADKITQAAVLLVLAYGLARMLQSLFNELRDILFIRVAQNAQRTIALTTFKHLHELSLAFHLDRQTGGLSRIIERGIRGIQFILSFMLFNIVPTILELFLVTVSLCWTMDYRFAVIVFVTIVGYVAFTLAVTEWRLKFRREMNREDTQANTKAIDSLLNFETVKYFGNEKHEYARFDINLARYEESAIQSQNSLFALNFGQAIIIGLGNIAILLLAVYEIGRGNYTVGDFVMLSTYMMQLFIPLNFLGFVYREVKQGLIDMTNMTELWNIEPSVRDLPDAPPLAVASASVEFSDVSFFYRPDRQILNRISFKIESGQTLAIVGASGSGKSTIARLLFRFYDPTSGQILIDGKDIREVSLDSLHQAIGVVPQDTVLFNDTIGYNIEYGAPGANEALIYEAAKSAKIDRLIERLPQKMETLVGERGLKLSGGEKQRVSIARTILKNPPILIFDEATSALDSQTEAEIQHELESLASKKTTLIIAHRLSTVRNADLILVLKDGEIVEKGRHEELMAQQGLYVSMWNKQLMEVEFHHKLANLTI